MVKRKSAVVSVQEVKTAAYLSQDPLMLKAFTDPKILRRLEGNLELEYSNPWVDLHTISAKNMYPQVFEGRPEWEWIEIASTTVLDGMVIRKSGKITNFSIQYGSSAKSISELNFVKLKIAESWIDGHKRAYPVFHTWAANVARLAEARGWAASQLGSIRWVMESNAKGQEEGAAGRLAVSHQIQSSAANQAKLALIFTSQAIKNTPAKLCSFIHDEIVIEAPGKLTLNKEKTFKEPIKDGLDIEDPNLDLSKYIIVPYYTPDEEAQSYGNLVMDCMNRAQEIIFNGDMRGSSSCGIGYSWGSGH